MVCVGTQCVPSVAARVVAKIYRPFFIYNICYFAWKCVRSEIYAISHGVRAYFAVFAPEPSAFARLAPRHARF